MQPNDYARHGPLSDPGPSRNALSALATDLRGLCAQLQGLLIHYLWLPEYGDGVPAAFADGRAMREVQQRSAAQILAAVLGKDAAPLVQPRPPQRRLAITCRHYSLLLAAVLRERGVPARARCGFATYFSAEGFHTDHWICEIWRADQSRWQQVDAQLDELQCRHLRVDFDPCDLPAGRFLYGGQAWQACRRGDAEPASFGIHELHGWGFIQGNVVRDLLALQRVEVLPWDGGWGLLAGDYMHRAAPDADDPLHALAQASAASEASAADHPGVRLPPGWDFSRSLTLAQLMAGDEATTRG
jgi:hypothetical protein